MYRIARYDVNIEQFIRNASEHIYKVMEILMIMYANNCYYCCIYVFMNSV